MGSLQLDSRGVSRHEKAMKFQKPLQEGKLIKRYKRFFADIEFEGEIITAHLPNTGSLKTVPLKETNCRFSKSDDPKRKLAYTLEMIKTDAGWAGVNTRVPNQVVNESLASGDLHGDFDHFQAEVKISDKSRVDFVCWNGSNKKLKYPDYLKDPEIKDLHFIEVKNVTMKEQAVAFFPDGVTDRGTKHLKELTELQQKGFTTEILFVVQRQKCEEFKIAEDLDPKYASAFSEALEVGVVANAYSAQLSKTKIELNVDEVLTLN